MTKCWQKWAGLVALSAMVLASCSRAGPEAKANWIAEPEAAFAESQKSGKMLLLMFTGSDWSPACQKMQTQLFDTKDFKQFADDNLVLYKADFPRKNNLDAHTNEINAQLAKRCQVEGFPTFLLIDSNKNPVYKMAGYMYPNEFLQEIKSHLTQPANGSSGTTAPAK